MASDDGDYLYGNLPVRFHTVSYPVDAGAVLGDPSC